jgi:putative (di)nucleoside polyphosphate hydrolase
LSAAVVADYRPCVGIFLLNCDRKVFVGRRIDMPSGWPAWQMPQGGIDPGETPAEAARRELCEEIGTGNAEMVAESKTWHRYDLPTEIAERQVWGGRFRGQRQKWFLMRFLGVDSDIDIATPHPEFDAWRWEEPARLPELIVAFKRPIYAALLDEFRDHLAG